MRAKTQRKHLIVITANFFLARCRLASQRAPDAGQPCGFLFFTSSSRTFLLAGSLLSSCCCGVPCTRALHLWGQPSSPARTKPPFMLVVRTRPSWQRSPASPEPVASHEAQTPHLVLPWTWQGLAASASFSWCYQVTPRSKRKTKQKIVAQKLSITDFLAARRCHKENVFHSGAPNATHSMCLCNPARNKVPERLGHDSLDSRFRVVGDVGNMRPFTLLRAWPAPRPPAYPCVPTI